MAFVVTIGGTDKTRSIEAGSLRIDNILTQKADTCSFSILSYDARPYTPRAGQEVVITDAGTRIFAGHIQRVDAKPISYSTVRYRVDCVDYTHLLDAKLVPDSFENQTAADIISSIMTTYGPAGFTTTNVVAPILVKYIGFNYKPISKCLQELAELLGYDWYVDYDKNLYFFAQQSIAAPFQINDNDGSYRFGTLIIRRDNSQVRNSIVVRGGEYLGTEFTTQIEANGTDFIFNLPYKYTDFDATLTGNPLNLGIDYINQPDSYDALYNFNEKLLRFKDTDVPSAGAILRVSGKPHLPVIVKLKSQDDIDTMASLEGSGGEYQFLIIDKSINSKEGARQRANAEILAYANTLSEGEFVTETSGLKAGQKIFINSTSRGIAEYFIINKVSMTQFGPDTLLYHVSLITTRTMDMIDILQKLLLAENKKIEIKTDEVIDLVEAYEETVSFSEVVSASKTPDSVQSESMTFGETFTAQSLNYPVKFVAGPYTPPSGTKRVFIISGSRLG